MLKPKMNGKGVALFIVLATILVIVILANILMSFMLSHSRLTHHQISRIQAYYATRAGMNYAYDRLFVGAWADPNTVPGGFYVAPPIVGASFPNSIVGQAVTVVVAARGINEPPPNNVAGCNPCNPPPGVNICVCSTVNYTYQ